jgi:DNA-directed RNA polymerase specialized sigma24 family protein
MKRRDQLLILDSVGLTSAEIGRILGQPSKDVASALKKARAEAVGKTSDE